MRNGGMDASDWKRGEERGREGRESKKERKHYLALLSERIPT